jgi:hypothetical protein
MEAFLKATTEAYHAIIYNAPSGLELKDHEEIDKIVWNTWTRFDNFGEKRNQFIKFCAFV